MSAFNVFFFMRRPSLVRLDLRRDLSRDPLFVEPLAPLKLLPRSLIAELLTLPPGTMADGFIDRIDVVDADDFRAKLLAFFGAFGYLNGLNDAVD